jgi:phage-related protein
MATLATLIVKLAADIGGFSAEMEKAALKSQRAAEKVGRDWKRTGDQLAGVGRGMTTAFTLPIVAGAALSVKAASDEAESWSKVTVVFGENSAAIQTWAANSATNMGISRSAAYAATGTFGNLFTTMGIGQEASATMSMELVQLASDLASFNNMDPTEVLEKLRSGLVGQSEPLRALGINLTQAAVEAKAMEMGLADADGAISQAALTQARYALMLEQSNNAAGDFARTSDGLANQMRIGKAELANLASTIGQMLLPYALQFLTWIRDAVAWFQALDPNIQKNILVVLGLVAVLGPLLIVIGSIVSAIGTLIPIVTAVGAALGTAALPVLLVIGLIIAAVVLLYLAWKNNWGGIQEKTRAAIDFVKGIIERGMQFISDLNSGKLGWISEVWNNTWNLIKLVFNTVVENIKSIFNLFKLAFSGDWHGFGEELRKIWDRSWKAIGAILSTAWINLKLIVSNLIKNIVTLFTTTDWGALGKAIVEGIVHGLQSMAQWALDQIVSFGQGIADVLAGFFQIGSPSKLMAEMIGKPLAMGVVLGWENGLEGNPFERPLVGAMATPMGNASAMGSVRGGGMGGGVVVQFTYAPAVSLGDRYEAEQVLAPMIATAVRRRLEQEG